MLVDDIVVSAQGASASPTITAPFAYGTHTLKGRIYDGANNFTEVTQSFVFVRNTINFPDMGNKVGTDGPFTLGATANSGLPVSYAVASSGGVATVSGNTVTLTGVAGSVTIMATQAGGSGYDPAVACSDVRCAHGIGLCENGPRFSGQSHRGYPSGWHALAWGYNGNGQLGDGTKTDRNSPVQVGVATNWVSASWPSITPWRRRATGTLWAWDKQQWPKSAMVPQRSAPARCRWEWRRTGPRSRRDTFIPWQ